LRSFERHHGGNREWRMANGETIRYSPLALFQVPAAK
jgi:hypothetical protein